MGCFAVSKNKKKKADEIMSATSFGRGEHVSFSLRPPPQTQTHPLLNSPPSFRENVRLIHPIAASNRARAMSAPSALDAAEKNALAAAEYLEKQEPRHQSEPIRGRCVAMPQPQPLPRPPSSVAVRASSSFKAGMDNCPLLSPLPLPPTEPFRYFLYEEIAAACHNFSADRCMSECLSSTMYKASFGENAPGSKKFEATVTRLHPSTQGLREFIEEVNTLSSLQHPNICRLLGFYARNNSEPRMLIYERLCYGSLDRLLFNRFDGLTLDWNSRLKIAICAAQGLTFLHDEGPFQAMYNEFSTAKIQIGRDFSAKLSGYGCVGHIPEEAFGNLSMETIERGVLTPKSNVWSFGIVLLELLTGRKNLDSRHCSEVRNLVRWCWPFLADDYRLSLIIDPRLKGRYPPRAAKALADIAQRCLQKEPSIRPNMRTVVKHLKMIQNEKYLNSFPLPEPEAITGRQVSRSPSLDGVPCNSPRLNFSPPPPFSPLPGARLQHVSSSPGWSGVPKGLPPRPRPSMEEFVRQGSKKSPSLTDKKTLFSLRILCKLLDSIEVLEQDADWTKMDSP